jgi:poly(ADP-ribose) glycohydrolase
MNDYYGRGILIDFSSKRLGGRVLRNGCKQEEILFLTYPELIVTRLLCEKLENDEAVIVYGARCFSKHRMQNNEFTFTKEYPFQKGSLVSKSVIVAIDAADFTAGSLTNIQYSKKAVQREINKAYAGF